MLDPQSRGLHHTRGPKNKILLNKQVASPAPPQVIDLAPLFGAGLLPGRNGAFSMNAGFVVSGCAIVGQAIPIGGDDVGALEGLWREQKLFPHFGEAGTAIFLIQEIEYGGHN